MVLVHFTGQTGHPTRASSLKIISAGMAFTNGRTDDSMMVRGRKTKCMGKAYSLGKTEGNSAGTM